MLKLMMGRNIKEKLRNGNGIIEETVFYCKAADKHCGTVQELSEKAPEAREITAASGH